MWKMEMKSLFPGLRVSRTYSDNNQVSLWNNLIILQDRRILIPDNNEIRTLLLSSAHDPIICGHFGFEKTLEKVSRYWWWAGIARDVKEYVKTCPKCQMMKHDTQNPKGLLQPILAPYPWHTVTLDLVGKFEPGAITANTYCLVMVDKFSKYTILQSVPETCDAKMVADLFLQLVISVFGVPVRVISDRGPQFTSAIWHGILERMGVQVAHASSHHPQTDGQSERAIQTFLRILRSFTADFPTSWENKLPMLQFAINDAYCEATKSTPFRVIFGKDPMPPPLALREGFVSANNTDSAANSSGVDSDQQQYVQQHHDALREVWEFVRRHQEEVAARMKSREDRRRRDFKCQVGDLVLVSAKFHPQLRQNRKQAERFYGPYIVHEMRGPNAVELRGMPSRVPEVVNLSFIKPFYSSPNRFEARPITDIALPVQQQGMDEPEWELERILDTRLTRRERRMFLVKWVGFPRPEWLDIHDMENASTLIVQYFAESSQAVPEDVQDFFLQLHYERSQELSQSGDEEP